MRRIALFLALTFAAPALAATEPLPEPDIASDGSQRWSFLVTYGDETCPPPIGDEIVVCAQLPESDRYRIPPPLRAPQQRDVAMGASWAANVESYQNIARVTRPDSCSAVGSYGFSGCTAAALRTWFAERQLIKAGEKE